MREIARERERKRKNVRKWTNIRKKTTGTERGTNTPWQIGIVGTEKLEVRERYHRLDFISARIRIQ